MPGLSDDEQIGIVRPFGASGCGIGIVVRERRAARVGLGRQLRLAETYAVKPKTTRRSLRSRATARAAPARAWAAAEEPRTRLVHGVAPNDMAPGFTALVTFANAKIAKHAAASNARASAPNKARLEP